MISAITNQLGNLYSVLEEIDTDRIASAARDAFRRLSEMSREALITGVEYCASPLGVAILFFGVFYFRIEQTSHSPRALPNQPVNSEVAKDRIKAEEERYNLEFEQEIEQAEKLEKTEPSVIRKKNLPSDAVCTLMATEIPGEYGIMIHEEPFDIRYFIKAMMTQKERISPYTKSPLTSNEIKEISALTGISDSELSEIWDFAAKKMMDFSPLLDDYYQARLTSNLSDLPVRMQRAWVFGPPSEYERLSGEYLYIVSAFDEVKKQALKNIEEGLRFEKMAHLLHLSQVRGRISLEFYKGFLQILFPPNGVIPRYN